MEVNSEKGDRLRRVGLVYDDRMCKHATADGDPHPENPDRIRAIWKKLESAGIPQRCVVFNAKEAEDKHILSVHSNNHVNLIKNISSKQFDSRRNRIASKFNSIYMNEGSSEAAYLAAGSVIEVAERVAKGELSSAFAIVRPPGHHAEQNEPMGFCLYNNVAIATSFLLNERPDIKKILIVDWDVHHGNGTQKMFWKDPRVLFFSVHRHEFGSFYPANNDGFYAMTGEGPGAGYNINVPWENGRCGDADYLAVWDHILIPVAKDFNPDIVIISAGFDAGLVVQLVIPWGVSCHTIWIFCYVEKAGITVGVYPLNLLMEFAEGKIIMALEGGYNLVSLANSVLACVEVLLEDKPIAGSSEAYPFESTWRVIQAVRQELSAFWPTLADELPKKLTSCKASPLQVMLLYSFYSKCTIMSVPKIHGLIQLIKL
ncbi:Histone deacetylase 5 [Vitis vinifera]|uniref:histone deacetylase n=1 Tax=Vitis vinifera TaxID=29760 RepID=A0A438HMC4_VITVI|nr:Histone deacetylase 5 [Vitis vinifera]